MKFLKSTAALLVIMLFAQFAWGQSKKMTEKAAEQVTELNTKLVTIDSTLALSADQKTQIQALYVNKLERIAAITKGTGTDEEKKTQKKEVHAEISKKVQKEILTKKQRQALSKNKKSEGEEEKH
jgi:outer membrane biosynthesis protein TonB